MAGTNILQMTPRPNMDRATSVKHALGSDRQLLLVVLAPGLRAINRIQGTEAGDAYLTRLERILREISPHSAVVGRLIGAKIALVLDAKDANAARAIVADVYDAIALCADGQIRTHIGAAWSGDALGADDMIAASLLALDQAKCAGPQGFELIEDAAAGIKDLQLAREALDAIRSGEISIAMQPVVDAQTPGRILFHEALIRLMRPSGELLAAGRFMPALERLGATAEVDIAALKLAAEELIRDPGLRVSVNLSAAGLTRPGWRAAFLDIADRNPDIVERLIVEVSEHVASSDLNSAAELFMQLRVRGVSLALDDFGAGNTSFQHLRDFRFDILKIDGGFISGIDASPDNQMLLSALTGIGRQFDMMVIAEAVETAQEARTLRTLGIEGFQGFLFGKPTLVWSAETGADLAKA